MTHALRGTTTPGRGDLTGRRITELSTVKDDHAKAKANTKNALDNDPVTTISLPGGRTYLVPVEVVDFLLAEGMRRD